MARTKATARASVARAPAGQLATKQARKSAPSKSARKSIPLAAASAESAARADGWGVLGEWSVVANDNRESLSWSFFNRCDVGFFTFDIGPVSGIAKLERCMADILPPRRNKVKFSWRGRETGEGEIQTSFDTQTGEITFKQQEGGFMVMEGRMQGPYCGTGGLRFMGLKAKDTPRSSSHDWDFYTSQQHEQERAARWK